MSRLTSHFLNFARAFLSCLFISAVQAQGIVSDSDIYHRTKPADAVELAGITQRGRDLAAFDQAAWHATDAVLAVNSAREPNNIYIGRKTFEGWVVAFGKLNDANDAFLLRYEVHPASDPLHPRVVVNTPALEDGGEWFFEARAVNLCRARISVSIPYNITVLPAPQDGWYVYTYPAQTVTDVYPTGADTRFTVSHDGLTLVETRHLHASLLENDFRKKGGNADKTTAMTFHTAFLDDAPEDTDVANVLMMGGIPMMVGTKTYIYKIAGDGTISYVMTEKAFAKDAKK